MCLPVLLFVCGTACLCAYACVCDHNTDTTHTNTIIVTMAWNCSDWTLLPFDCCHWMDGWKLSSPSSTDMIIINVIFKTISTMTYHLWFEWPELAAIFGEEVVAMNLLDPCNFGMRNSILENSRIMEWSFLLFSLQYRVPWKLFFLECKSSLSSLKTLFRPLECQDSQEWVRLCLLSGISLHKENMKTRISLEFHWSNESDCEEFTF